MKLVKICGLTSATDALFAQNHGADFLGIVMHQPSKRFCTLENAKMILSQVEKPTYAVFGYDDIEYIIETTTILKKKNNSLRVQLPFSIENFSSIIDKLLSKFKYSEILPAYQVTKNIVESRLDKLENFPLILLDSPAKKHDTAGALIPGGSGESFNWSMIKNISRNFLLAGGLNPYNIKHAVNQTNAIGFDVASGTESSPGKKDLVKLTSFITQIKHLEQQKDKDAKLSETKLDEAKT